MRKFFILIACLSVFVIVLASGLLSVIGSPDMHNSFGESLVSVNVQSEKAGVLSVLISRALNKVIESYLEHIGIAESLKNIKKSIYSSEFVSIFYLSSGVGEESFCGDTVKVSMSKSRVPSKESYEATDLLAALQGKDAVTSEFILDDTVLQNLRAGMNGIKVGADRLILSKKKDKDGYFELYRVQVLSVVHSDDSLKMTNIIRLDENIIPKTKRILCGDNVSIRYVLRNSKGTFLGSDRLNFIAGNNNMPLAIDKGVIGMIMPNKRVAVSPGEFLIGGKSGYKMPVNSASVYILEFYP